MALKIAGIVVGVVALLITLRLALVSNVFDHVFDVAHDKLGWGRNVSTGVGLIASALIFGVPLWWSIRHSQQILIIGMTMLGMLYIGYGIYASNNILFDRTGKAQTWITKLPGGGVKISDEFGYDNGVARQLADPELAQCVYMARTMKAREIPLEETHQLFDSTYGQPKAYWGRDHLGKVHIYEGLCFEPGSGERLKAPDAELKEELRKARREAADHAAWAEQEAHKKQLEILNAQVQAARAQQAAIDADIRRKKEELQREKDRRDFEIAARERENALEQRRQQAEDERQQQKFWNVVTFAFVVVGGIGAGIAFLRSA